jgi:hypothetical protein
MLEIPLKAQLILDYEYVDECSKFGLCFTKLNEIHYMTKSMWTPVLRISHSKIMGINMELVPPLLWEGFPLDVETLLRGLASVQPQEH